MDGAGRRAGRGNRHSAEVKPMGTESNRKIRFYMDVNGQTVEVEPNFAEITFTEKDDTAAILPECKCEMRMKTQKSMRCRSRKRFVKLLMASGISRNVAQALARGYVIWSNRIYIPEYLKATYQGYFIDLCIRGLVKPGKAGRSGGKKH